MMKNISEYFDKIYCVNLDRRKERWNESSSEFQKWNIKGVERVSAIDGNNLIMSDYNTSMNPGELGLVLTNINIIKDAIEKNYNSILILEDDVVFNDEINNISNYMELLPNDWNMLYFGGNHNTHMGLKPPHIINEKVCKLHNTYTTHCIGIKNDLFEILLKVLPKLGNPLDVEYAKLQKIFNIYSFYPAIAKQRIGFSDIQNKTLDYNWLIK
jgi:glycosyl transferase family 25